jgi:hypothetical protein
MAVTGNTKFCRDLYQNVDELNWREGIEVRKQERPQYQKLLIPGL